MTPLFLPLSPEPSPEGRPGGSSRKRRVPRMAPPPETSDGGVQTTGVAVPPAAIAAEAGHVRMEAAASPIRVESHVIPVPAADSGLNAVPGPIPGKGVGR